MGVTLYELNRLSAATNNVPVVAQDGGMGLPSELLSSSQSSVFYNVRSAARSLLAV